MFLHKVTVPDLKASTLAVDANRRIIVADSANRCIHVISLDTGHYNFFWYNGGTVYRYSWDVCTTLSSLLIYLGTSYELERISIDLFQGVFKF